MDREIFFNHLYQFCDGMLELRALPLRKQVFLKLDDISGVNTFCNQNGKDDLYFGVGTRDGKGGKKENIIQIPCVWADIDYKETPREIIADRLKQFPFKPSTIIKSGGGIHLYWCLKEPSEKEGISKLEDINRRIASQLGGDFNACDAARVLRIPDTVNHKPEYREDNKPPPKCEVFELNQFYYELDDFINILPEVTIQKNQSHNTNVKSSDWLQEAMKGVRKGERNATGTKIAGYWINKLPPKDILTILQTWNLNNTPPLPEKDIQAIVKSVSRYEPDKSQKRVDICHVYDSKRMLEEYRSYLKTLTQNRFITGISEIDKRIRGVAGGEVLTFIARAGSFKTAMLQNLLKNYIQNSSWGAIFFSIEMPISSVTERYHGILGGVSGREVEELYLSTMEGSEKQRKMLEDALIRDLKNLLVVPVKVSISDIASYVRLIEQEFSIKIGVIGIDYLGLMDGPGLNEYEIISRLSRDIKNMAKMLNLPVVLLSQVSRKGGGGEVEISLDMGRGSGAIEEGADFILGLWQSERKKSAIEDQEPEYDLICRILKNRKGPKGSRWKLDLDPSNLRIGADAEKWEPPKTNRDVL